MEIRIADQDDLDRLIALRLINAEYHADLISDGRLRPTTKTYFSDHSNKVLNDQEARVLVGTKNEVLMAYAIGYINQQHPIFDLGNQGLIDDVYVAPEFERQGLGEQLISELTDWFKKNKVKRIELNVYEMNSKGASFWKKRGFKTLFTRNFKEV